MIESTERKTGLYEVTVRASLQRPLLASRLATSYCVSLSLMESRRTSLRSSISHLSALGLLVEEKLAGVTAVWVTWARLSQIPLVQKHI